MVAYLVKKDDNQLYCSVCRMRQTYLKELCEFCWRIFSNYEDILLENINDIMEDETADAGDISF